MSFSEYLAMLLEQKGDNFQWSLKWNTACWFPVPDEYKQLARTILAFRK